MIIKSNFGIRPKKLHAPVEVSLEKPISKRWVKG